MNKGFGLNRILIIVFIVFAVGTVGLYAVKNTNISTQEIKNDDNTVIKVDSEDKIKAKYSLEYLKKMIAGGKLHEKVSLYFNTDYPLKLEYKVTDRLLLSFILAPRVDND